MQPLTKPDPLTYKEAYILIGGLSAPSKMPWHSWSTSALDCKTGSKLRKVEGSTCSKCYACKGNYTFPVVKQAHARKLEAINDPRFVEAFVLVLTTLYLKSSKTYNLDGKPVKENRFRWHDSGDIQSVEHLSMINEIARQTPFLNHWLPTREYGMVNSFLRKGNTFSGNLTVRMSAIMMGTGFEEHPMGLPFSTVGFNGEGVDQCVAYSQGGKCLDCNACWDKEKDVNYPKH